LTKIKAKRQLSSYRPIGLANTLYKLWTRMVTNTLYEYAEAHSLLSSTQEGFHKKRKEKEKKNYVGSEKHSLHQLRKRGLIGPKRRKSPSPHRKEKSMRIRRVPGSVHT